MQQTSPIRVVLVDDHAHIHQLVIVALASAADIQLVAHASNGHEALLLCEQFQPDVVLMDVVMPVMDGFEAAQRLHDTFPQMKILVLSSYQDDSSVHAMLNSFVSGYVLKSTLAQDLITTIRAVHAGQFVLSAEVAQSLLHPPQSAIRQQFALTNRELEVLRLTTQGLSTGEIALKLVISPSTVKFHMTNILLKMGVKTRAEAIVLAAKNDLI